MQPLKKIEKIQENKNPSFSEDLDRLPNIPCRPSLILQGIILSKLKRSLEEDLSFWSQNENND
jgi:hypothetical protein